MFTEQDKKDLGDPITIIAIIAALLLIVVYAAARMEYLSRLDIVSECAMDRQEDLGEHPEVAWEACWAKLRPKGH